MQATTLIFQLLDGKPEQEQNLLRLLVNKLVCRRAECLLIGTVHNIVTLIRVIRRNLLHPKHHMNFFDYFNIIPE